MTFTHDISQAGLSESTLAPLYAKLRSGMATLAQWKQSRKLPMLCLPEDEGDLAVIEEVGAYFREHFAHVLVVGTGGSSLGGQALAALKDNPFQPAQKGVPKLHFLDNVDPATMDTLLATLDFSEMGVLVISKSGGTAEIIAQALVLIRAMGDAIGEDEIGKRFAAITVPQDNPLRKLAGHYGMRVLDHDPAVGGRYSVLSLVGLIPAAIAGLDVRALRKGAAAVMAEVVSAQEAPENAAVAVGAAAHMALMDQGKDVAVLMPYCDRLSYFGMWFRQLWAESLGKDGKGSTPVKALGTVDQHSQLQLYLAGPKNKFITLITQSSGGKGPRIDGGLVEQESLAYIRDKSIGDVLEAHQHGTTRSLVKNGCAVRIMHLDAVDEEALGALLMHFMLETILTAHLMGIDAYDQPAVEESKVFARDYLLNKSEAA